MKLIVAVDEKWGIGKSGDLLKSIPDDMLYYRATTRDRVVVMGYATLLSLPHSRPAPGRLNLVLADIQGLRVSGAVVCGSMDRLLELIGCFEPDDVFDIGGGSMYRQLMPYCSDAHITKMQFDGGADTHIPNLDELAAWSVAEESERYDYEGLSYAFVVYHNDAPLPIPASTHRSTSMSRYFKKREPVWCAVVSDERYRCELLRLLNAYFHPLADGFGDEDVARFLSEGDGVSFEQYLRENRLIADAADIAALEIPSGPSVSVHITKENYADFAAALNDRSLSMTQLAERFG